MTKNLLFEIGLEELPAHIVVPSMNQLKEKTAAFLQANRLPFDELNAYSTPRRLAIYVSNIAEKQTDIKEEVKGPAKKIALDADGNWSKAAEGFVRGQSLKTEDITFKAINGVDYVYVTKQIPGKKALDVLSGLKEVIMGLTFPVTMHWNRYDFEYIRPIRWLVALLGDEIIPFQILDVKTDRISRGHRFLGSEVSFENADQYLEKLKDQFVLADSNEREAIVVEQIIQIASEHQWQIDIDHTLLEEVTNLVEYPTAFVGNFDSKYLAVPEEVLVTSMKEHQRYFDVRDENGRLLPHFISVRNGDRVKIDNVIKGNEKVLIARLEDAEFFYQEDQKLTIAQCIDKLKNVAFHEKIGSMYEKMLRVKAEARIIGENVGLTPEELADLDRAAEIYKFDLVTNMVGEFPELQGVMGEKYALLQGEKPEVAQAIHEHYLPVSSEGELPISNVGSVLAIADKLDSVLSFFAVGMRPSGSNDPYALRRQSYGIVRIIAEKHWLFPFTGLQRMIEAKINANEMLYGVHLEDNNHQVIDFLYARLRQFLLNKQVRHDIIEAVIQSEEQDLHRIFETATILKQHAHDEDFKPSMEALTRVVNLAKKLDDDSLVIDPALFENEAEKALYEATVDLEEKFAHQSVEENYESLVGLRPLIENYFAQTMVMVEDDALRNNHLRQLRKIAKLSRALASLESLITK